MRTRRGAPVVVVVVVVTVMWTQAEAPRRADVSLVDIGPAVIFLSFLSDQPYGYSRFERRLNPTSTAACAVISSAVTVIVSSAARGPAADKLRAATGILS